MNFQATHHNNIMLMLLIVMSMKTIVGIISRKEQKCMPFLYLWVI